MYIYFGSSLEGTIILLIVAISLLLVGLGAFMISVKILLVLNKIKEYIKRRGDK